MIVCDLDRFVIRTNWTNTVSERHEFTLEGLRDPSNLQKLKWAMSDPDRLRPGKTRQDLTKDVAAEFAALANNLRKRGHDPQEVAHFVNRLVFCMFAEDANLLPNKMFVRMLEAGKAAPDEFKHLASTLFAAMKGGGLVGFEHIEWFNGGLFDDSSALPLTEDDIALCLKAASLNWSEIDPSIFGTLFVRGLDPDKRSETGSEYTDREKIMMIIEPVISRPLVREWEAIKATIIAKMTPARQALDDAVKNAAAYPELAEEVRAVQKRAAKLPQLFSDLAKQRRVRGSDRARASLGAASRALTATQSECEDIHKKFMERLRSFRVLDPACGSGNFLYLALIALKDFERRVVIEGEALGFHPSLPQIGPEALLGIEINGYAAELARVSVWIGEIQWMRRNGFGVSKHPILKPLDTIRHQNAIIADDMKAVVWPGANVIIGNPPYLGAKLMKRRLGASMTNGIRALYKGRLPGFTDLVCYWFENARAMVESGITERVGLVATNSIRKNTNLPVMHRIVGMAPIFEAWNEEQWTVDGAAVDVSLICFGNADDAPRRLNGETVVAINPDLTAGLNLTVARSLKENRNGAFLGIQKSGPFDVSGEVARAWMAEPANPNGHSNVEILKPYWNGDDLAGRPRDMWFIDLPLGLTEANASLYEKPFRHIKKTPDEHGKTVQELRNESGGVSDKYPWWQPWRPRPEMRSRIERLRRYIVTPETAQYRLFAWLSYPVLPDKNLIVIPRDDDLMFGILHSRFHAAWALRKGADLEDRPRYTHTTTFATFPFPDGMTPGDLPSQARALPTAPAIEAAAAHLNAVRDAWLYPADLVVRTPEGRPGFPDRLLPRSATAANALARRTLTSLYNEPPDWLAGAHRALDDAVAIAYGWPTTITDDDALSKLLEMNLRRASQEASRSVGAGKKAVGNSKAPTPKKRARPAGRAPATAKAT